MRKSFILLILLGFISIVSAQQGDIYHGNWIDLNKNGKMDPYENPKLDIEKRIDDLLSQMNVQEKTCQMVTLYGYQRVLADPLPTPQWKDKLWKDGIGAIDEHLNGFRGWGKAPQDHECVWPASKHAWAINEVQKFFIEQTRLGIPVDFTNEGIRGIESYKATNFPTQLGIGHTWNRELVRKIGEITGQEARLLGYTNVYAPILDVGYDQRWGRYEEIYSESPYLCAELGVEMVLGLQKDFQVASTAKHFAVYSVNKGAREGLGRCDPKTSPREIENIFLKPFKEAIKRGGALGVMSSYNDYDGVVVQGSKYWLTDRLRNDFGFKGYVVSDSDAVVYMYNKHKTAATYKDAIYQSVMAGLNVRCTFRSPDSFVEPLRELISEGRIPMNVIDDRVRDILRVKFMVGIFDKPYVEDTAKADKIVNCDEHQQVALKVSQESLVLLKNDNLLPLNKNEIKTIAVCGPNADDAKYALTHYGPVAVEVTTVLQGIRDKVGDTTKVIYTQGCDIVDANWPESEILPMPLTNDESDEIAKAVAQAKAADIAVVVVGGNGRTCGENKSRTSLNLPGRQLDLLKAVHATGTPVVVVLISGRPLSINWTDKNVPAILAAWYPGSQGGKAIADVLFGDYNPGGKLSVTFPRTVGQLPMNFPAKPNSQIDCFRGGSRVNGVLYPFGYGLSYTKFKYSNLKITPKVIAPDDIITVMVDVTNIGKVAGDEIVQLYTRDVVSSVTTYEKNLRGFDRIHLKPGQSRTVQFIIKPDDIQLLNENMQWVVEPGEFSVMIGASSVDIKQKGVFTVVAASELDQERQKQQGRLKLADYVKVTSQEADNPIANAFDGDLQTRWATSQNIASVDLELVDNARASEISIAWYKGNGRKYDFEIQLSGGGGQWITVFKGKSSGYNNGLEKYEFNASPATDLRIICKGNSENSYNAITEIVLSEFKGN
ncbi:MAG: glycoside hydrolase family 3 C-terminal domain-containing protein [Phycisphaerae bacterium]|nr:glycoside hydrolase family 3 C-terminal domain-containing protein [Phycisphaerae bacterium]